MQRKVPDLSVYVDAFPFPGELVFEHPWREAADEAALAYRAWCEAPSAQRREAHATYRAAEEREAAAAEDLRADAHPPRAGSGDDTPGSR